MIVSIYVVVVFFKQKTADEMRISDWSSDVCSSDLIAPELARGICEAAGCVAGVEQQPRRLAGARRQDHRPRADPVAGAGPAIDKIGRASCRERVWQYV